MQEIFDLRTHRLLSQWRESSWLKAASRLLTRMTRAAKNIHLSHFQPFLISGPDLQFSCVACSEWVGSSLWAREPRLFLPELRVHQCFQHARSRGLALELPTSKDGFASRAKVAGRPRLGMESMLVCDPDASMLPC